MSVEASAEAASEAAPAPEPGDLAWYLGSTSGWMAGYQLQTFLITWLLVGILHTSEARVGLAQLLIGIPGFLLILFGGASADRIDARALVMRIHAFLLLPPLLLLLAVSQGELSYLTVVLFGMAIAAAGAFADPARAALLNRISAQHIQRLVSISMIVTSGVGLVGFLIGGQLERLSLPGVLMLQAGLFAVGGLAMWRVTPMAVRPPPATGKRLTQFLSGFATIWRSPVLFNVILLNFISGLVNAGAFFVALPFIAKVLYASDAQLLSWLLIVFFCGSISSNGILLRFMPLAQPGRLFLIMQLSRVLILGLIFLQPPLWAFFVGAFLWGMNMGVTTTLVRAMVQEVAPLADRGKVLSVLILGFTAAQPLGSALLGQVMTIFASPLAGLVPGICISALTFVYGVTATPLWRWRSAS